VSEQKHFELCVRPLIFFRDLGKVMIFLCGAPRISAISAFKKAFSAQRSQRYAEHRTEENPTGKARVQVKIDGAETSKRLRSDLPLI
jgi:hypothetical protein